MSGDSVPLPLSLVHFATDACEVTMLYRELRPPLLRYLVCLGLSADDARDIVQDAFLTLHRHLSSGGSRENIRGWLFRVAHNRARNQLKSYARRYASPLDPDAESMAHDATPEHAALAKERIQQVGKAIRRLPDRERACLFLRAAGLRVREIADVLDLPISTVADTLARAIKKLAEQCHV